MRSLEFKPSTESPFVRTDLDLQAAIGQEAHQAPSVFSFFRPEYRPAGRITSASLVSPESQGKARPNYPGIASILLLTCTP